MNLEHKILLVEDDPNWSLIIGKIIDTVDLDISLYCVPSAEHAEQLLCRNQHYDLIIADQNLDGTMTGFEFWQRCRNSHLQTPFMLVSSITEEEFLDVVADRDEIPIYLPKVDALRKLKTALLEILPAKVVVEKIDGSSSFRRAIVLTSLSVSMAIPLSSTWRQMTALPLKTESLTAHAAGPSQLLLLPDKTTASPRAPVVDLSKIFTPTLHAQVERILGDKQ